MSRIKVEKEGVEKNGVSGKEHSENSGAERSIACVRYLKKIGMKGRLRQSEREDRDQTMPDLKSWKGVCSNS